MSLNGGGLGTKVGDRKVGGRGSGESRMRGKKVVMTGFKVRGSKNGHMKFSKFLNMDCYNYSMQILWGIHFWYFL